MDQAYALRNRIKLQEDLHKKDLMTRKPNARLICVTSGKGGVGKSNIAVTDDMITDGAASKKFAVFVCAVPS